MSFLFPPRIRPPSLSGGLLFAGARKAAPSPGPGARNTGRLADRVLARADEILSERELMAAADRNEEAERAQKAQAAQPPEVPPDILAGITKHLAAKHRVPDVVASEAVMKAYDEVRQEDAAHLNAPAPARARADAGPAATPARAGLSVLEDLAAASPALSGRRPRRPTPF